MSGWLVGVDEAGRGPLAGPVVAAAVILDPERPVAGLADSKTLGARQRQSLSAQLKLRALAFGLGEASPAEIDALNILQATFLAMRRALEALAARCAADGSAGGGANAPGTAPCTAPIRGPNRARIVPVRVVIDGNRLPGGQDIFAGAQFEAIVRADALVPAVSAASILAKVHRDAIMAELDRIHPGYGFARHQGYPTAAHRAALVALGPSPVHRRSFGPVLSCLR
jgi:ribonuclease HII